MSKIEPMPQYTIEELNALNKAIALGVLRVEYDDQVTEYRSLDEMLRTQGIMMRALGLATKPNRFFAKFSKGLK